MVEGGQRLGVAVGQAEVAAVEVAEEGQQLRPLVVVVLGALGEGVLRGRRLVHRQRAHPLLDVCKPFFLNQIQKAKEPFISFSLNFSRDITTSHGLVKRIKKTKCC